MENRSVKDILDCILDAFNANVATISYDRNDSIGDVTITISDEPPVWKELGLYWDYSGIDRKSFIIRNHIISEDSFLKKNTHIGNEDKCMKEIIEKNGLPLNIRVTQWPHYIIFDRSSEKLLENLTQEL